MWIFFAFATAVSDGLQNLYYKKTSLKVHPILVAWSVLVITSILFSPMLFMGRLPASSSFWIAIVGRLFIDSIAYSLYVNGVQRSPLSLTVPMLSLSPIFGILTVFVINGLLPSPLGFVGIFLTVSGIYFLHFDHDTKHIFSPFHAIAHDRGVLYAAIAAILWSIVTSLQKLAIDQTNPYFYTAFFQLVWAICFAPIAYLADKKGFHRLFSPSSLRLLGPLGFFDAAKTVTQNIAYFFTNPVYVNIVSNTSILFTSFFGWYFFKEKLEKHVVPTILIVLGIICIALA